MPRIIGIDIPDNQASCYGCWRRKDRKKNPELYEKDRMFPANGPTPNTVDFIRTWRDVDKDFIVDDLPEPMDLDWEEFDEEMKKSARGKDFTVSGERK